MWTHCEWKTPNTTRCLWFLSLGYILLRLFPCSFFFLSSNLIAFSSTFPFVDVKFKNPIWRYFFLYSSISWKKYFFHTQGQAEGDYSSLLFSGSLWQIRILGAGDYYLNIMHLVSGITVESCILWPHKPHLKFTFVSFTEIHSFFPLC